MRKTLLVRGVGVILSTLLVVLLVGCSFIGEMQKIQEQMRVEEQIKQEEGKLKNLYEKINEIGIEYYSGKNEAFIKEFEVFLEKNFISKERILNCMERLKKYNDMKYEQYLKEREQLKDELNTNLISSEEFEEKSKRLEEKYEASKNRLGDYFTNEERKIFENSKDEIERLYNLIQTTKGAL